jgi:hypothetical protein
MSPVDRASALRSQCLRDISDARTSCAEVITWLSTIRVELCQVIYHVLQLLYVTTGNGPLQVCWEVYADPFCSKLSGVASRSQQDKLVLGGVRHLRRFGVVVNCGVEYGGSDYLRR